MNCARVFAPLTLALTLFAQSTAAQTQTKDPVPAELNLGSQNYHTLYLTNITQQRDANDIVTDLRNMLPRAKVYYVPSQNAISMIGSSEDFLLAKQILSDIDRTRKIYRLTYTIAETDGSQPAATQHVTLLVPFGGEADLKQGSRVPILVGTTESNSSPGTQVQYMDVGLKVEASLSGTSDDLRLRTEIEDSTLADDKSGERSPDPVIRQTSLVDTSTLTDGKQIELGSLDIPGSTHHMEIAIRAEPVQ